MIEIKFDAKKILVFMFSCVLILFFFNTIFFWLEIKGFGSFRFNSLFYLNEESNIPTYFSGLNLMFAAILTFILSLNRNNVTSVSTNFWRLLSIIFLFLSFDEVAMFHERIYRLTVLFTEYLNTPLVWYVPYSFLALFVIIILWKNFFRLDFKTKIYMGSSAIMFLMGSIIFEHISNNCESMFQIECGQLTLFWLSSIEEILEMFSICIFNYSVIRIFEKNFDNLVLHKKN